MKAVIVDKYGGPEALFLREVETPIPGPGRLRIKLNAAGVNPVDTYLRSGAQGYRPSLPFTPGIDGAGIIDEIGEGVIGFAVGMEVYVAGSVSGTYAEYCLCSPGQIFPLPDKLNWLEGACLGVPYFTAARALYTLGDASPGDVLLINGGSGGVGLACLQLASDKGMTIIASAGSAAGKSLVLRSGAAACFDHGASDYLNSLKDAAGPRGFNLIVEMRAELNLDNDIRLLSAGGRVVVVGSRGPIEIAPRDLMSSENTIQGLKMSRSTSEERREYSELIKERAETKKLKPPIAAILPLKKAADAQALVMKGPHCGNIVLEMNESTGSSGTENVLS